MSTLQKESISANLVCTHQKIFDENTVPKTGDPTLTSRQKSIRTAIENGKVYFEEFRLETEKI